MSYQVLARKWRPKTFAELMGQEHVVSVLVNAISQQRLHHAYLFTGTRGVGKTTIARIFAKSLNCEQGVSAEPCGKCDTCLDIDQGRFVDLLEIDAASRTKVDDTREILDNVQYAPTRGRYKVYLIDEVHMLSRSSFNALLKTLEEPPEHVKFILATTDPQKLPVTVLSRCLQFHLKALSVGQIEQQLEKILNAEQVTFEAESLNVLAKAARGSMRDSLSLTDQAIAQGQGHISVDNLQHMLGGVDQHWPYKILIALVKQDTNGLMTLSQEIAAYAPSYQRLHAELLQLLHHVAMYQITEQHFDLSTEHSKLVKKFASAMSAQDIQLYYQLVLNGRKDLPYAGDEQAAFDMTLLRLLAFKPMSQADAAVSTQRESQTAHQIANKTTATFDDIALPETQVKQATQADTLNGAAPVSTANSASLDSSAIDDFTADNSTVDQDAGEQQLAQELLAIEQQAQSQKASLPETHPQEAQLQETSPPAPTQLEEPVESAAQKQSAKQPEQALQSVEAAQYQNGINGDATTAQPAQHITELPASAPSAAAGESNQSPPATSEEGILSASVESALATRNMLRSRKKKLESKSVKKSDDATERQTAVLKNTVQPDVPAIETLPTQGFAIEQVDPSVIKKANQVDKWANMIDAMALNGRLRILAQQSVIGQATTDEHLVLELNQSAKHLITDSALTQLRSFVSEHFNQPMMVDLVVVDETVDDPLQIQSQINDKRYDYAKQVLASDPIVNYLQTHFQAILDESSIIAR
ncbi:DNA polymerase III subunit gamma/tau [Thalassotalea euphylliae]|uniref:DNA polymerase III subunit gamma/tau n=1 Tax=Thalassotalea euphylliae TaxID=1655234 RepID=A0A3E0TR13_9GAMM|nr:DNA polymerase III subunit gamma/tau [Thalassotalea euphylliae]REL26385.1 DNA polymerase III subunit gamma/tau [Thalassotalea euphylliae]